ncbi:ANTAR domain protein [Streptomyces sp. HCCB10043]|nr:ANTAR domain protein [Streptomyces sp. HCCB10043]
MEPGGAQDLAGLVVPGHHRHRDAALLGLAPDPQQEPQGPGGEQGGADVHDDRPGSAARQQADDLALDRRLVVEVDHVAEFYDQVRGVEVIAEQEHGHSREAGPSARPLPDLRTARMPAPRCSTPARQRYGVRGAGPCPAPGGRGATRPAQCHAGPRVQARKGAIMTDDGVLTPGPPDLVSLLLDTDTLDEFLLALAQNALLMSPTADGCGVTLERENRPLTVASAGVSAPPLDEAQYGQDDGPCLEALREGHEVSVSDMREEGRWNGYPAFAVASGTRSSLSLPIAAHSRTAGALNLYSPKENGFADVDLSGLRALAAQATGAVALAQRLSDTRTFTSDLEAALQSRSVIDQAAGIVMNQRRCGSEEALRTLRTASQHRNVKLRDLCAQLVGSVSGTPPTGGPGLRPRP